MKWTGLNDLREIFLSFFESKGHTRIQSYPLIPQDDKSLLLINSGMAPMKKFFLGQAVPPNTKVTTCQKCIRTPDIERVGKTARHGTYFEMLGNFSFGDYFKKEAIAWAWEFVTEVVKLPQDKLWVSIYQDDDEAFDIWTKETGFPADRIVRLGKEDNFWEIGSGPCGPCSEFYFDRGEKYGCGKEDCGVGCECDRFVEFWNLVFTQYISDGNGNYTPMKHPNIDTGMGLERLACIMQNVDNLFEVDTMQKIMNHVASIANVQYKQSDKTDVSLRVITDHIRSTTFIIADGVLPSNEGRGYVLRRLLRRAARHGKLLGIDNSFLHEVCKTVIQENSAAYPELENQKEYIIKIILTEEQNFARTIDKGMDVLARLMEKVADRLSGEDAFTLYDTYGFPIDLTEEIISERHITVDMEGFQKLMEEQRLRAKRARANAEDVSWVDHSYDFLPEEPTEFVGYDVYSCQAKVLHIIKDSIDANVGVEGDFCAIVLDRTPFYAESGGQVADTGVIVVGDNIFNVTSCQKTASNHYLHIGEVMRGSFKPGNEGEASIDHIKRKSTMRNHTAAHLVQKALRNILGEHVHQAGQLVSPEKMRFDFNHFEALTPAELFQIEDEVNTQILAGHAVTIFNTDIKKAQEMGAMALFGEKYGEIVRVVDIDGYSLELCGGTHVSNTSNIGSFKIISENSVASGVRRLEAITGAATIDYIRHMEHVLQKTCKGLKVTNPLELPDRIQSLNQELRNIKKDMESLQQKNMKNQLKDILSNAINVNGVKVISASLNGMDTRGLRVFGDRVKEEFPNVVAVISSITDGKGSLLAVCGKDAVESGLNAGKIVKEIAALAGGKGGGRADSAMAGVTSIFQIDEALAQLPSIVQKHLQ